VAKPDFPLKVYDRGRQGMEPISPHYLRRMDGWILQRPARAGLLLAVFILTYFVLWSSVSFLRHYYFHSRYDLATQDQVVWNSAQGHLFSRSLEVTNDLGDHVRLYLAPLSLTYLVVPSPYVLLAFQAFVLALTAWPLYRLARRKFDSPVITLMVIFCALAYPPLGFLNRDDFHAEVIVIPLLTAAYERIDVGDLKRASIFLGLALLGKEHIGLTVAALGLLAALYHKHRRFGLAWIVGGLAYSSIALFVVIPAFRGAPSDTLARYQWLGDTPTQILWAVLTQPIFVLNKIASAGHFLSLLQLLGPLAFFPLLSLPALLPAVPTLSYNFLSQLPAQASVYNHYVIPVVPFMAIAGVLGLHRMSTIPWKNRLLRLIPSCRLGSDRAIGLGASLMLVATLASWSFYAILNWTHFFSLPRNVPTESRVPLIRPNDAAIREGLKLVPGDAYLVTTDSYGTHLSHRRRLKMIPRGNLSTLDPEAEAIFLNLKDLRWWSCDDYVKSLKAAAELGFGIVYYRDSVLLAQKDKGDLTKLKELLTNWQGCK
jgi:uncharacterized membrane protein